MREGSFDFGWLAGTSVGDVVRRHSHLFSSLPFVMIASIDSDLSVSDMAWAESWSRDQSGPLSEDPFVVSGATLCRLVTEIGLLTGFDEIWIADILPAARPPREVSLTAPLQLTGLAPRPLREWLRASGWRLGLGDGFGLNFASTDRELSRALGLFA